MWGFHLRFHVDGQVGATDYFRSDDRKEEEKDIFSSLKDKAYSLLEGDWDARKFDIEIENEYPVNPSKGES